MNRRHFIFAIFWVVWLSACSLLNGPQQPVIPTLIPTAVGFADATPQLVTDPVSSVVPRGDADIQDLVNSLSQQQLLVYVQTLEAFGTRNTYSAVDRQDFGIGAARSWIYNEFVRMGNGRLVVEYDDFPVNGTGVTYNQQNIVATLPGTGSDRGAIIISAHYDSRTLDPGDGGSLAPGANDNATGVAILLELSRLLSSRTWNQDIVFVAFAAEEQGRFGSTHFVADKMLDGWTIEAVLNNDIVGGHPGIPQSIRVFSPGPDTSPPRQFARYIDFTTGLYIPTFAVDLQDAIDRPDRYSDHMSFLNAGVTAVRLTESVENVDRQHNALDTSDQIDFNYLRQVAQLNLIVTANAAGSPPPPPQPTIARMADPGAFILTWPTDPTAAGYAISFRPVGSADYPPFRFVNGAQAGNVALTGFDPQVEYAVSLAAITDGGRIGLFSPELIVSP